MPTTADIEWRESEIKQWNDPHCCVCVYVKPPPLVSSGKNAHGSQPQLTLDHTVRSTTTQSTLHICYFGSSLLLFHFRAESKWRWWESNIAPQVSLFSIEWQNHCACHHKNTSTNHCYKTFATSIDTSLNDSKYHTRGSSRNEWRRE